MGGEIRTFVYITPSVEGQGPGDDTVTMEDPLLRDAIVYLTCVHELGHAVGLGHTSEFEDIMYSFGFGGDIVNYFMRYRLRLQDRSDIDRNSGLSANDRATLLRLYENPRGSRPNAIRLPRSNEGWWEQSVKFFGNPPKPRVGDGADACRIPRITGDNRWPCCGCWDATFTATMGPTAGTEA